MDLRTALLACTASLFLGLAGGVFGCRYVYQKDALEAQIAVDAAKRESAELGKAVDALQEQAGQRATAANQHRQENEAWGKEVAALKAKLARVKSQSSNPEPAVVQVQPVDAPADTAADQLKDQIIAAQDKQIEELKGENKELRLEGSIKDQIHETDERRIRGLEIALDAQEHAATSGKWLGRLQGFAIGVGIGFAGGKP